MHPVDPLLILYVTLALSATWALFQSERQEIRSWVGLVALILLLAALWVPFGLAAFWRLGL